ncbi:RNA degradosome polyphosphate kinase [Halioglobus sp. HI00S01]|uniref:polyphosphate kinase 1 n=1 Tax=Halioglobus sp. HI00S01 TaxID=1822214 RepID=UPI0007C34217|nr:polyphosphate kinase 1 [Halioglobus sp. HI00S01]KZX56577.1 RNA degradosome polyphosphate kinase [Halioglobus sp. HI00S01]
MANPIKTRAADLRESDHFYPRELSWLSFNERVLQEAADESVPIIERLRYLGIFSNNGDEFFRVRVAEVRRLISVSSGSNRQYFKDLLVAILDRVAELQQEFDRIYSVIMQELARRKIYLINERQLDEGQAQYVQDYFSERVLPELEPILLREDRAIPALNDESIYLAVDILSGDSYNYAVVEVPTDRLERFVEIPRRKGKGGKVFIALDNVIRACLPQMFRGVIPVDEAQAYCFKFSRDAELEIDTGITQSLIDKMAKSLKQRKKADAVRMVYDSTIPQRLLDHLCTRFGFGKYDSLIAGGRYHNSKDFMSFPNVGPKYLEHKPLPQIRVERLECENSIFDAIRDKDVFLYYPYHPFDYVVDFLKTAALDPDVTDIKICLYRVAKNSRVIDALVNAVDNGKRVLAVVELAARFDEEANISWAQRLTENGINVIFGIPGLKVHSKLILIERREGGSRRYYSHIGTGNFNEKTARVYTDFTLMTYDQNVGKDVYNIFDFLQYNYRRPDYRLLLVSPHSSRPGLLALIDQEIENARAGYRAEMTLKCNNLVDRELVKKLYEASAAGVQVHLIVRGMCSLLPGVKGLSDNIQAISIVDRYLEHPRVYVFYNRGNPRYMIGSADLMTRNLDFRVEALVPIFDQDAQEMMQGILDQQWHDNVKARVLDADLSNAFADSKKKGARIRSQESIHRYLSTGKLPRFPSSRMRVPAKRRRKKAGL